MSELQHDRKALGGAFTFPGTDITVGRMGYGAMRLAGPDVLGPPADRDVAIAILRAAVESGVNHIDTADSFGPHTTNQLIRDALHPYPDGLTIVTTVGVVRGKKGTWDVARSREELTAAVHDNLRNLGLDALPVVNLRVQSKGLYVTQSVSEPLQVLVDLKRQGLIRHIGLSDVSAAQVAAGRATTPIVCVQNEYDLADRDDDDVVDELAAAGIAYVPYFSPDGYSTTQSAMLSAVAGRVGATPMQVALAWLLQRSPNMVLIPGTSSVGHLRENLAAADLTLRADVVADLNNMPPREPVGD